MSHKMNQITRTNDSIQTKTVHHERTDDYAKKASLFEEFSDINSCAYYSFALLTTRLRK